VGRAAPNFHPHVFVDELAVPHVVVIMLLRLLLLSVAAAVSSCALSTPPTRAETQIEALPPTTPIPPRWAQGSSADTQITNDWVKSFNDAGLEHVVAEALANNTDLRQAAAQVEMARQAAVLVGAQLTPHIGIDVSGEGTRDLGDGTFKSSEVYGQLAWELDLWGRLRAKRAAAVASYQATALDYAFARQSLAATTGKNWYLASEAQQLVALAEQSVQVYTRLLQLANAKYAAGRVSALDVAEASAHVNEAQSELRRLQGSSSEARRNLEVLVGRFPGAELDASPSYALLPPPITAGLPASLLERRPDILAAEQQVLASFRSVEASRLALLPALALTTEGGRFNDRILDLLHLNPNLIGVGLRLFQPVFQGGALRTAIKIATARQEQTVANYGSVALKAFREVEVALTNEELLGERLRYQNQALANRSEAVRIATLKYRAGALSLLPVLQLQTDELATRAEIVKLRDTQLANRIQLHLALGGQP
jgi:NodT family efflux transporter outer membrane factor (OMF) lipoprotein